VLLVEFEKMAEAHGCRATAVIEADYNRRLPALLVPQIMRVLIKLDHVKRAKHQAEQALQHLRVFASAFKVKLPGGLEVSVSKEAATGDLAIDLADLFIELGQAAQAADTAAIILIDEIQCLDAPDLTALIMALHKVAQRGLPLLLMGAGLPQMPRLAGDAKSYAERLFQYTRVESLDRKSAEDALVLPAKKRSVRYEDAAVKHILAETQGYPFYIQVWGEHAWDIAPASPIRLKDAVEATKLAIATLDNGIFATRLQRMTEKQIEYARAMAELPLPARSTAVANTLGVAVEQVAAVRDELIKKGHAYSPKRGLIAFTVPLFDQFLRRQIPTLNPPTVKSKSPTNKGKARKAGKTKNGRQGKLFD
jgi:hypothetical protein